MPPCHKYSRNSVPHVPYIWNSPKRDIYHYPIRDRDRQMTVHFPLCPYHCLCISFLKWRIIIFPASPLYAPRFHLLPSGFPYKAMIIAKCFQAVVVSGSDMACDRRRMVHILQSGPESGRQIWEPDSRFSDMNASTFHAFNCLHPSLKLLLRSIYLVYMTKQGLFIIHAPTFIPIFGARV